MKNFTIILATIVVFWNVENFYDYFDSGQNASDTEFSPSGTRHWTKKRFLAKCNAISKTIFHIADLKGSIPDIIAFAEVENDFVLKKLIAETSLRKTAYRIIHYDSRDHRGIDVALLYDASRLNRVCSKPVSTPVDSTRDILLAQFTNNNGDSLAVLINHFPSKYGGSDKEDGRISAAKTILQTRDSLVRAGWSHIIAMGDFNETPDETACALIGSRMTNLATGVKNGDGTIKYNGKWELIDQAFVSEALVTNCSFEILYPSFLLEKDSAHSGMKPLRTFVGPKYNAGASDHLPICVAIQ